MRVSVRSSILEEFTGKPVSDLYPVKVQGGPGMLSLDEAYFWSKISNVLGVFRQIQLFVPEYAILVVEIPKWWTNDQLKKAKVVGEP